MSRPANHCHPERSEAPTTSAPGLRSRSLAALGMTVLALALGIAPRLPAQISAEEYARRRETLLAQIDSGVIFAAGAREPVNHFPPFYQLPAFRYLTGLLDPDASLVLVKRAGGTSGMLFVAPLNARTALYHGRPEDPGALARKTGLEVRNTSGLLGALDTLTQAGLPLWVVADIQSNEYSTDDSLSYGRSLVRLLRERRPQLATQDATPVVDRLRARRSPAELELLRKAVAISDEAHRAAMQMIAPGKGENEVQATIESTFRRLGGDRPAYSSIVGSGPNSTVLHYPAGRRVMQPGEVILMDVATSYEGYAADITRTVPVDGTYTPDQRTIYTMVLEAQKAAERLVRPGVGKDVPFDSARAVLKRGLAKLGLIEGPDAVFDAPEELCPSRPPFRRQGEGCPQWYLYTYHGYGHGIGLDVHDPAQYNSVPPFTFQPGDAFTIEPGLYVRTDALEGLPDTPRNRSMIAKVRRAVERYRNIGVRIEDDYFVTSSGVERVSQAPREISEIEAEMRRSGAPRT
jgi:Xaa-Pro aminopeptidase